MRINLLPMQDKVNSKGELHARLARAHCMRARAGAYLRPCSWIISRESVVQRFCTSLFSPMEIFNMTLAVAFFCSFVSIFS